MLNSVLFCTSELYWSVSTSTGTSGRLTGRMAAVRANQSVPCLKKVWKIHIHTYKRNSKLYHSPLPPIQFYTFHVFNVSIYYDEEKLKKTFPLNIWPLYWPQAYNSYWLTAWMLHAGKSYVNAWWDHRATIWWYNFSQKFSEGKFHALVIYIVWLSKQLWVTPCHYSIIHRKLPDLRVC